MLERRTRLTGVRHDVVLRILDVIKHVRCLIGLCVADVVHAVCVVVLLAVVRYV